MVDANPNQDGNHEVQQQPEQNVNRQEVEEPPTLPSKMTMNDPRRNWLTPEELERAKELKDFAEGLPDLDRLSDYMMAQYAVVLKGGLDETVERAYAVQAFRKEYDITDTYEDGCRALDRLFEIMPDNLLGFSFSEEEGTYVFVHDATTLDSTKINTPNKADDWMRANYYIHATFCPDMESIRKGIVVLAECEGWDWTKKQDFKLFKKLFTELVTVYPFYGQIRHYHTGSLINIMVSMLRQLLPKHLKDRMIAGLKFEGRLDKFFLLPDPETARRRMLHRMKQTLKRRYEHEKTFSLDDY